MNPTNDTDETSQFPNAGVTEIPWVDAPPESHLKSYRFVDRKFAVHGGPSELYVWFREKVSKKTGKITPEATYVYLSMDHLSLRQTFEKMTIASSPGTVLSDDLIKNGNKGSPV